MTRPAMGTLERAKLFQIDGLSRKRQMSDLLRQMKGYRLTTAEILYHQPDHPVLLQSFVWQEYDIAPRFPVLNRFLQFWVRELDGKLHSVRVAADGNYCAGRTEILRRSIHAAVTGFSRAAFRQRPCRSASARCECGARARKTSAPSRRCPDVCRRGRQMIQTVF